MLSSRLRHTVTIERATEGARDEYGVKAKTWATHATVKGWLQPTQRRELQQDGGDGTVPADATLFLMPTDITEAARVVVGGVTYAIVSVLNVAGKGQHYECVVRRTEVV